MNNRISFAVERCQRKNSEMATRITNDPKVTGTSPIVTISLAAAGITSFAFGAVSMSEYLDAIRGVGPDTLDGSIVAGVKAAAHLAAGVAVMMGVEKISGDGQKKAMATRLVNVDDQTAKAILNATRNVMETDAALQDPIFERVKNVDATFSVEDPARSTTLQKFGLNPKNKPEMEMIKKAYVAGLQEATFEEVTNYKHFNSLDSEGKESFINRSIVKGMVEHIEKQRNEAPKSIVNMIQSLRSSDMNPHEMARAAVRAMDATIKERGVSRHKETDYGMST